MMPALMLKESSTLKESFLTLLSLDLTEMLIFLFTAHKWDTNSSSLIVMNPMFSQDT